jgi:hypothetical protein
VLFMCSLCGLCGAGATNVTRELLVELALKLPFADVADAYVGYKARPNAESLR